MNGQADEYRCVINGANVEVYTDSRGLWRWRAGHYEEGRIAWWGRDFRGCGERCFDSAADAMQAAMRGLSRVVE